MDTFKVKILGDGTIRSTTDQVSAANHAGAEKFFEILRELTGGEETRERAGHGHVHAEGEAHSHDHVHLGGKK
jgi:hypothetical protein